MMEPEVRRVARPPKRNGAKAAAFRHFLTSTYGEAALATGSGVLDIAGGQASLSWELLNYHGVPVTVVDPRPCTRARRFERRFEYHSRQRASARVTAPADEDAGATIQPLRPQHWPVYWRDEVWRPLVAATAPCLDDASSRAHALEALAESLRSRPTQPNSARRTRKGYFAPVGGKDGSGDEETQADELSDACSAPPSAVPCVEEAWRVLHECSIVVGLHPDSATESIVDFALAMNKPFAVVPCCVCAVDFPNRRLPGDDPTSYDAFVSYLVSKAPDRIGTLTLPFEGRNVCVFSLPKEDGAERAGEPSPAAIHAAIERYLACELAGPPTASQLVDAS